MGLALSGLASGFDWKSIVDQLIEAPLFDICPSFLNSDLPLFENSKQILKFND
jgi:hypothetical protein